MISNIQAVVSVSVCQALSDFYQPINLFRYDNQREQIYILAGINDTFEIVINLNGRVEFL